jgi:galactose mutarotase-like enzyme
MQELQLNLNNNHHGLRSITLENNFLKLVILPEVGGRVWQITYKPHGADLLWNHPHISPQPHALHSSYDDVWSGGWDELFPNDEEAVIDGLRCPDHGEAWTGRWDATPLVYKDEIGVKLTFVTPISSFRIEKTIVLNQHSKCIHFHHRFTNLGKKAFPFLWKLHPAFHVTPQHKIDFPPMQVSLEDSFPGTMAGATPHFEWPYAQIGSQEVDLRRVCNPSERQLYFLYGSGMKDGWCALTNTATGLSCGLRFDPTIFRSCWLFASYGGWNDLNVAVLEPCTGYPLNFEAMVAAGRQKTLNPGETFATDVLFTVQEGLTSVEHIDASGEMHGTAIAPTPLLA